MVDVEIALKHNMNSDKTGLTSEWKANVIRYLTNDFKPHCDLADQTKNVVLWSTAMFIENMLSDWGLSGGFWVGSVRFANNDVQNLRDRRTQAMELFERTRQYVKAMTPCPRPQHKIQQVAFVYIVADRLGFGCRAPGTPKAPHLLMIGHNSHGHRHWGVPGGQRDPSDESTLHAAMREMMEELLGKRHPSKPMVTKNIQRANGIGAITKLLQTPSKEYTAWMLRVPSALSFEMTFNLPKRPVTEKYYQALSTETRGYLWIPLPLQVTTTIKGINSLTAPSELNHRPLMLRGGVLGPSKLIP